MPSGKKPSQDRPALCLSDQGQVGNEAWKALLQFRTPIHQNIAEMVEDTNAQEAGRGVSINWMFPSILSMNPPG
jgi:hypothetical protein